jgi:hypothetical protein
LGILHHNIQSLGIKVMALHVLLSSWSSKPAILCFPEHWLYRDYLLHINIDHYKLVGNFCMISNRYGGSCIFVLNPNGNKEILLELLEETLNKVQLKGHHLVSCRDWNINLLEKSTYQKALQSLLLSNNLQNTG